MIPIFEPKISVKAKINVNKALKDNWISSQGNFINQFEKKLAKFHNRKFALVTSSCTTALHLSLLSLNLKRVMRLFVQHLHFIAPANMVLLSNLKLKLIDIDPTTLTIDVSKLKKLFQKKQKP